jgi:DNA-binding transcriptional ArsR family regulator
MRSGPDIARLAAALGDPARAAMASALMGGQALTAGELAEEAGVTRPTASAHLARLAEAGVIAAEKQGRHRYHRIASAEVAAALESLMTIAARGPARVRPGPRDPALRRARVCYDHLAGALAVALYDALAARGTLASGEPALTERGEAEMAAFGIDLAVLPRRRPLCRACLDWSERRPHLAGALGAALLDRVFARGWARRVPGGREVAFSAAGEAAFRAALLDPGLPAAAATR